MSDLTPDDLTIMAEQSDEVRTIPVRGNGGPNTAFIKRLGTRVQVTLVSWKANVIDSALIADGQLEKWLANREDW